MKLKFVGVFIMLAMSACTFAESFKIVALPDTQLYSQNDPSYFNAQTQWVVDNVENESLAFLTHLGDIVNTGADAAQWTNAVAAMNKLDGVLPYSVCLGNHDLFTINIKNDGWFYYSAFFGATHFADYSWFGGTNRQGTSSYQVFEADGRNWLHLNMEYMPDVESLQWAQRVLDAHPDMPAIYSTHAYITDAAEQETIFDDDPNTPGWCSPSTNTIANIGGNGQWSRLIANNDQIFMVLCGHSSGTDNESMIVLENIFGHEVYQLCQDYQSRDNGGDGWMRLFEIDQTNSQINVTTYSPSLNTYETDENSQFTIDYDFSRFDNIMVREEIPTVQAANIQVIQFGTDNEPESVNVFIPEGQHTEMFGLTDPNDPMTPNSNRGDYHPQIGSAYSDDAENGVFFACVAENGRTNEHYYTQTMNHYHTASIGHGETTNWLSITTAGQMIGETYYAGGHEDNVNVGAAYFPFSGGWVGGYACNLDNNGATYVLKSSDNLTLGKELITADGTMAVGPYSYTFTGDANWQLTIPGVDSRTDGVLLACGGKNEDNYAVTGAALDGSGWVICVRDNAQLYSENDPFNFVYIPFETPGITAGVLSPKCGIYNGTVDEDGLYNFAIEHLDTGTLRLTIDGYTPETGTLLVAGNVSRYSTDNIITYEPDGDGWLIYVYDLNNAGATNLQDMNDEGVQFAFIPFDNAPSTPGPSRGFDSVDISAADFVVNTTNDISVNQVYGSVTMINRRNHLSVAACDRGDFYMTRNGVRLSGSEGVLFASAREERRQEPGVTSALPVVATPRADSWIAISSAPYSEYNANFAAAFFPYEAGYTCGNATSAGKVSSSNGLSTTIEASYKGFTGRYLVSVDGVTPDDGILFATTQNNGDSMANIIPDGDSWDIASSRTRDAAGYNAYDFAYMYVPYTSREIMLGRVDANGDAISGNSLFSVTKEETGVYRLTMVDGTPADGMLIMNSYGSDILGPAHMILSYETDGDDFIIYTAQATGDDNGATRANTEFVFGYVPFDKGFVFSDCNTNIIDFAEFAAQWLNTVDSSVFDYDNSNKIDQADLPQFADCWLN